MTGKTRTQSAAAFTLVELMISIALALMLMIGISQVFKYTSATAGATQAVSDGLKNARAAQSVFYRDFSNMVTADSPSIIISSSRVFAFRGDADAKSDADTKPYTADFTSTGTESPLAPAVYDSRSHRTDILSFFVRDLLKRSTGGALSASGKAPIISDLTSNEGWIWYGHLWQPDNTFTSGGSAPYSVNSLPGGVPGTTTLADSPYNFYATNWNVGRVAMVLKEKDGSGYIPNSASGEMFIDAATPPTNAAGWLAPLAYGSTANSGGWTLESSRFDMAATSILNFRNRLQSYIAAAPGGAWWDLLMGTNDRRFQTQPYLIKPLSPASYAKQIPQFIPNCTHFIVEYAGDFMKQDDNGTILDVGCYGYKDSGGVVHNIQNPAGTDGKPDFIWVGTAPYQTRQIRWYGLPRDVAGVDGTGHPTGPDGNINGYTATMNPLNMIDVVPLRDVMKKFVETPVASGGYGVTNCVGATFEKTDYGSTSTVPTRQNYVTKFDTAGAVTSQGMNAADTYTAAWGPDDVLKPSMIRITIVIDDPAGRIAEGQSFEYVFKVQ